MKLENNSCASRHSLRKTRTALNTHGSTSAQTLSISPRSNARRGQELDRSPDGIDGERRLNRLLTRREVQRRLSLPRSSLYELISRGEFPRPKRIGRRAVRWPEDEVDQWVEALPRSTGDRGR